MTETNTLLLCNVCAQTFDRGTANGQIPGHGSQGTLCAGSYKAPRAQRPLAMDELERHLRQFTGTEHWYRHQIGGFTFTDGVKAMADRAGAYWLIDLIGSYQRTLAKRENGTPFQIWRLVVEDSRAVADVREDTDAPVLISQRIPFTDFPVGTFELFFTDNVLLLKSEY